MMDTIINNWVDEQYMNILLHQYEDTRIITEKLDKLEDNRKIISKSFVIGLLKNLNNILLEKYTIEDYLTGVDNLCRYYNMYDNNEVSVVKIHWMKQKYRLRLLKYIKD